jgi:hypothetical protein
MKIYFQKHKKNILHGSYLFFLNLAILSIILFLFNQFSILDISLILSHNLLFVIGILSLLISLTCKYNFGILTKKQYPTINSLFETSKYFFLAILLVVGINQFLKLEFLTAKLFQLTILGIFFGFITFYKDKDKVEKELKTDKEKELKTEEKRKKEFPNKFPRINKIPVLRGIVKWMYLLGWKISVPLILIISSFLLIRFGMPLIFNGSYLDEYFHIFSGIDFFKTGNFSEIYLGELYLRGFYISFLEGLFLLIFPIKIYFAKLLPVFFGIINFILYYKILRKIILKKDNLLFSLIFFTIFPLIIFNHFYIRMFIFYEFALLLISWIILRLEIDGKKGNLFQIIVLLCINIFFIFAGELEGYPFLLFTFVFLLYLTSKKLVIEKKFILLVLISLVSLAILIFLLTNTDLLSQYLSQAITYGAGQENNYFNFFFIQNSIITLLFFLSIFIGIINSKFKGFFLSALILFLFHFFISDSLKVIRGILYFIPLFILVATLSLDYFKKNKKYFLVLLILICVFFNFIIYFTPTPNIPNEINYMDFNEAYSFASSNCVGKESYGLIHDPYISLFYEFNYTKLFYINPSLSENLKYYGKNGTNYLVYGDILVDTNSKNFEDILNNGEDFCMIISPEMRHSRRYITESNFNQLKNEGLEKKSFYGIDIFME